MAKVKITVGSTYVGCPSETIELEYYGNEKNFNNDHEVSTEILNLLTCSGFGHYFMDYEFVEDEEDICWEYKIFLNGTLLDESYHEEFETEEDALEEANRYITEELCDEHNAEFDEFTVECIQKNIYD